MVQRTFTFGALFMFAWLALVPSASAMIVETYDEPSNSNFRLFTDGAGGGGSGGAPGPNPDPDPNPSCTNPYHEDGEGDMPMPPVGTNPDEGEVGLVVYTPDGDGYDGDGVCFNN